jgi:hypothetical protein
MPSAIQLTANQLVILKWIADGCPDDVYTEGFTHRIVARALSRRGLVDISGHGPTWKATITEDGAARLHAPAEVNAEPQASEIQLFWDRVEAAGGSIRLDFATNPTGYDKLLRQSLRWPSRPFAKQLVSRMVGRYGSTVHDIWIDDYFTDQVEPKPVPVPGAVRKYHRAVQAYLDDNQWQYVSKEHVTRAAHILQAVAAEGEKRGLEVLDPRKATKHLPEYQQRKTAGDHLTIIAPAGSYTLRIRETPGKGAKKLPYRTWGQPKRLPDWQEKRGWEFILTGKLELVVEGRAYGYHDGGYRDSAKHQLEDLLPEVFRAFEIHALLADKERRGAEREALAKQARWERAMEVAKGEFQEHHRGQALQQQFEAWQRAKAMEQFVEEMQQTVLAVHDDEIRAKAREWLEWSTRHVQNKNPLAGPLGMPEPATPKPEDLRPFLRGSNPNGPNSHY